MKKFIKKINTKKQSITIVDHCGGFDKKYNNYILDFIRSNYNNYSVFYHQLLPKSVKIKYSDLQIKFDLAMQERLNFSLFDQYPASRENKVFKSFMCTFLGSEHISRQFLSSVLYKTNLWNNETCTKNFVFSRDTMDGNLRQYVQNDSERFYIKFFLTEDNFNSLRISKNYQHCKNVQNLNNIEKIMSSCFVTIVSETMGTSYVPFITEKFLESIVTKNLFVSYAQPDWHSSIENHYGFKLYKKIFNYNFDKLKNPVHRVVSLVEMLSKFQNLSTHDWHDLYLLEKDTIDYNYDHYCSKSYLKNLAKFV